MAAKAFIRRDRIGRRRGARPESAASERATARLLRPALHRHRGVRGHRAPQALVSGSAALIVAVAIASILIRGFTFGIDFEGGTKVSMPAVGEAGTVSVQQVEDVFSKALGKAAETVVIVGSGGSATVQIRSET